MDADLDLYSIIFGESIFNDAIGIVMYETVLKFGENDRTVTAEVFLSVLEFCKIFLLSILIGALFALGISYLLKR